MSRLLRTLILKIKSPGHVVFGLIVESLLMLSSAYVVSIPDLQSPASVSGQAVANDNGRRPRFRSNSIMVKLTPEARASLKVSGEEVNPAATGLPSLDAVDRDHGVQRFTSVTSSGPHRNPTAAIHRWFKLTLPGNAQRLTLIESTNDDVVNLTLSGAELLGRLVARLKREPSVESVDLDYVVETMFVPNDPYYSTAYPTSKYGNVDQWAPQFISAPRA